MIFAEQSLFHQNNIQRPVTRLQGNIVDHDIPFQFLQIFSFFGLICDITQIVDLIFQVMTFTVNILNRITGDLILPFLLLPHKPNSIQFPLQAQIFLLI